MAGTKGEQEMSKRKSLALTAIFLCGLLMAGSALAMSASNYRLDWLTLAGGGGGPAGSASYAVNLTVGQTVIGVAASPNYRACLGYWCGMGEQRRLHLPLILRESP
jgi:hypothetical protein